MTKQVNSYGFYAVKQMYVHKEFSDIVQLVLF